MVMNLHVQLTRDTLFCIIPENDNNLVDLCLQCVVTLLFLFLPFVFVFGIVGTFMR